jgi:hypothetical protein
MFMAQASALFLVYDYYQGPKKIEYLQLASLLSLV